MNWLKSVFLGLICFGLGIVFTYWIQGQIVYENIQSFFITGTTLGVSGGLALGVVNLFVTLHDERKKEKEKAMVDLRKHTEDIVPILRKWVEQSLTSSTEHLFSFMQQHIVSGEKLLADMIQGAEGIDNTRSRHNETQRKIDRYIRDAMEKQFLENCQDTSMLDELVREIQDFHEKQKSVKKSYTYKVNSMPPTTPNQYYLQSQRSDGSIKDTYIGGGKKENLETLAKIMNDLLVDSHLHTMIETLLALRNRLYELQNAFRERINLIINEINYAVKEEDKILAGKCGKCKAVKDKWHIR